MKKQLLFINAMGDTGVDIDCRIWRKIYPPTFDKCDICREKFLSKSAWFCDQRITKEVFCNSCVELVPIHKLVEGYTSKKEKQT